MKDLVNRVRRSRYRGVVAVVIAAFVLGVTVSVSSASRQSDPPAERDPMGRPIDAPGEIPLEHGRVPVIHEGRQVGWVDAFDVFGPPAGSWEGLPPPSDEPAVVYDRSDPGGRPIGTLGPGGFEPGDARSDYTTTTGVP
jgi:hypothetical protein